ncbi:sugar phosphotransferase [Leptospira jelokensis]|uniref:Sugar phosphotransferase n=1 Tax=Leptospira jelokensis TaxID=2484931 RepID=A0A4Z0ZX52_9LEPT|nr:sugar phosphotransferase [Leptospira jelokensis]TGL59937.1 sugar phosphotransferase [Leptospira jelokensis]
MPAFFPISFLILGLMSLILHSIYVHSRFGVKDVPNERSLHDTVTKKSGGMFFIPVFLISTLLYLTGPVGFGFPNPETLTNQVSNVYLLLAGVFVFSILGFIDDLIHLSPKLRLFLELGIVWLCLWVTTPNISFMTYTEIPSYAIILFLTVFLVFGINLVNFMDGMDWYLVSTFFICFFSVGLCDLPFYTFPNLGYILYAILFVSMFGFIFYNFPKAKLFMGDSGSLALGFFVFFLPLLSNPLTEGSNRGQVVRWDVLDYFYLFPFFWIDGITILLKRFSEKKHLFQAHREHLYQTLTETNVGKVGSLVVFSLLNGLVLGIHILLVQWEIGKLLTFTILFLISLLLYGIVWVWTSRKNLA